MRYTQHSTGFSYGLARITMLRSSEEIGVRLVVAGMKEQVEIHITRSGLLRVGKKRKADGISSPVHETFYLKVHRLPPPCKPNPCCR